MVTDINKIKNLPSFSVENSDMLIGFSVVGLAKTPFGFRVHRTDVLADSHSSHRTVRTSQNLRTVQAVHIVRTLFGEQWEKRTVHF